MSERRWCIMDLVTDATTGRLRETAVWSNVGKLSMTWAFCYTIIAGTASEWLWIAYGGIVVAHEASARFFNQRAQQMENNQEKKP
jgi:hypothetical protein